MMRRFLLLAPFVVIGLGACKSAPEKPAVPQVTKLQITDSVEGKGKPAAVGDTLLLHYKGMLNNGVVFDQNKDGQEPLSVTLGAGRVIKGWEQGLIGIKEGGKRTLKIPYTLGYGAEGFGDKIGPNQDLTFDVELVKMLSKDDANTVVVKINKPGTGREIKAGDKLTISFVGKSIGGTELINSKDTGDITYTYKEVPTALAARGIEAGMQGMKLGEQRTLTLPPGLGLPPTPGNMSAGGPGFQVFEVTLKAIK